MAILHVFAVRDSALDAFNNPFCVPSRGVATRGFADEVRNTQSPMNAHPQDYTLYFLGTFDTDFGVFNSSTPEQVLRASDVITD